jgi:hypothetical protein
MSLNMSPYEPTGFAKKLTLRKESARQTLRQVSCEELRALVLELFLMEHIHGRRRFRNSSKNIRQNRPFAEKLRTVLRSFITRGPIAASGMSTPAKPLASVCSAQPPSSCFPKSSRKPDIPNLEETKPLAISSE